MPLQEICITVTLSFAPRSSVVEIIESTARPIGRRSAKRSITANQKSVHRERSPIRSASAELPKDRQRLQPNSAFHLRFTTSCPLRNGRKTAWLSAANTELPGAIDYPSPFPGSVQHRQSRSNNSGKKSIRDATHVGPAFLGLSKNPQLRSRRSLRKRRRTKSSFSRFHGTLRHASRLSMVYTNR